MAGIGEAETRPFGPFLGALRDLGYTETRNFALEARFANGDLTQFPRLALELVKADVDIIVTAGTPAARAAQQATRTIPIVVSSFSNPVALGFAKTLARPGQNITGLSNRIFRHGS